MRDVFGNLRHSLVFKVILTTGMTLLLCMTGWSWFNLAWHKQTLQDNVVLQADRLINTIRLGTHYAMMLDSEDDIRQIVHNVSRQPDIAAIRIFNKQGTIKFTNRSHELESDRTPQDASCRICHARPLPPKNLPLSERTRTFEGPDGIRRLGIVSPVPNEPACWQDACHAHNEEDVLLGLVEIEVSLAKTDAQLSGFHNTTLGLTFATFAATFGSLLYFIFRFVNHPIQKLIAGTRRIAKGGLGQVDVIQDDEIGQLAQAINEMGDEVFEKHSALNKQRKEYQTLFEGVPCLITVQDTDFKLLSFNQRFAEIFDPEKGDYCFKAYKGFDSPCANCPVKKTFADGQSHISEEAGVNKDGSPAHWLVTTSPIRNEHGEIVAAMEMCLDITQRKALEVELQRSEQKYHAIFNSIPNPVFVLDPNSLTILDTNDSMRTVYGFSPDQLSGKDFLEMFLPEERDYYAQKIGSHTVFNHVRHRRSDGLTIFVELRISPASFTDQRVLLATTGDITKRLEAEQQLIQASKMATLGEMATGVAHELNQPLSVIKTASSFFMKKIRDGQPIKDDILQTMSTEIDASVDRATRIISHLREFGRKPEMGLEPVDINEILRRAHDMFSQQLKLRQIETIWNLDENLPLIQGDSGRLEQVFINLLLNSRDAIEERWGDAITEAPQEQRRITFTTLRQADRVVLEISDTGPGIPRRIAERIFEPFFTTKRVGKGTGLGLSISYGIVQDCGGSIRACTDDDSGARFVIQFPVPPADTFTVSRKSSSALPASSQQETKAPATTIKDADNNSGADEEADTGISPTGISGEHNA